MGEDMNNRVNVLDVGVDDCSAKEALKKAIEFLMGEFCYEQQK